MKQYTFLQYLLLSTIVTLPFAGIHFFVLGVPLYTPELLVIIASALFVWIKCHTDTLRIQKLPASIMVSITLLILGLVTSALSAGMTSRQLGIIKSWFFFPMLFGWLLFQIQQPQPVVSEAQPETIVITPRTLLLTWYATLVGVSCVALVYFFQGDLTYDDRLKAFYLSPNYLALFIFPGVILGWYFIHERLEFFRQPAHHTQASARFYLAVICLSWIFVCTALYLTLSYTIITASLIGFFITLFLTSKRSYFTRITLFSLCIACISLFLLFQMHGQKFSDLIHLYSRSSLASRIMIWQSSWKMITDHPLLGIGPGNFQTTYLAYQQYFPTYLEWAVPHPHNLYLSFWLQTGIIGLIGFILLVVFWTRGILRAHTTRTQKVSLSWILIGILITLLCIGLLDTPYWKNDLAYTFWLLIALGL